MPVFDQEQYRPQIHDALVECSALVFDAPSFATAEFRFRDPIGPGDNATFSLRPVTVGADSFWQATRASESENLARGRAKKALWDLVNSANVLLEAHVDGGSAGAFHLRTTKKGHVLVDRRGVSRTAAPCAADATRGDSAACSGGAGRGAPHDHVKDYPLSRFDSRALLLALGFSGPDGDVRPSMHPKFRQVNQFLALLSATLDELPARKDVNAPFHVVDCGCGKAYLSFAAKAYLESVRGMKVRLSGMDRKPDVIAACRRTAETLGWGPDDARFEACDIASFKPDSAPDAVLSLHACDTATDEAIAFGVERGARAILAAPCCQHELQKTLSPSLHPHQAILRNGILRERLADILTDAFRAQLLRVAGYRASVVEFVDPAATARNVLIRAVRVSRPGTGTALADYEDLRSAWNVSPWLADRLSGSIPALSKTTASRR